MIMNTKTVAKVIAPATPHFVGDGFRVHGFIPRAVSMQEMDPFLVLDYNSKYRFSPSEIPRGVGVHPHKGFETVTLAYKGSIEHADSSGNQGIIGEGDVQWMTAAKGILHKEFHEREWSKKGGEFQMVQLWVNLPAQYKGSDPKYQSLRNADITKVGLPNNGGEIEVIAGSYEGHQGSADTFSPIHLYNAKINKGVKAQFSFPKNFTTALLVIEGRLSINDNRTVAQDHFVKFNQDGEEFSLEAVEDTVALILSGEPLKEPIVAHGPFVMNSREEIVQAFDDFASGKFGHLE